LTVAFFGVSKTRGDGLQAVGKAADHGVGGHSKCRTCALVAQHVRHRRTPAIEGELAQQGAEDGIHGAEAASQELLRFPALALVGQAGACAAEQFAGGAHREGGREYRRGLCVGVYRLLNRLHETVGLAGAGGSGDDIDGTQGRLCHDTLA
jgi:hypothetical protein